MKEKVLLLAVALFIGLPSVEALNCTLYHAEYNTLCGIVNPLALSESDKSNLMRSDAYGNIEEHNALIVLSLNIDSSQQQTLNDLYKDNVNRAFKIFLFILVHYVAYSVSTKSSILLRWLNVGSLT